MLDSTVELLVGLCLIALPLMISFCMAGSIVAALRAVSRRRAALNMKREGITMARGELKNRRELGNAAPGRWKGPKRNGAAQYLRRRNSTPCWLQIKRYSCLTFASRWTC